MGGPRLAVASYWVATSEGSYTYTPSLISDRAELWLQSRERSATLRAQQVCLVFLSELASLPLSAGRELAYPRGEAGWSLL